VSAESRPSPSSREFAVLIPILRGDEGEDAPGGERVILCVRPDRDGDPFSGQVCLPGGAREPGDASLRDCALRETEEEIGVPPSSAEVIDELDWHATGLGHRVKPFVARIDATVELRPNSDEVREVLFLPVERIVASLFRVRGHWTNPAGEEHEILAFDLDGCEVWGLTARILRAYFLPDK
jgi:8-oxo-dGTP pyrophosphatase MutT (NUDIX family)